MTPHLSPTDVQHLAAPCAARIVNFWRNGSLNTPRDRVDAAIYAELHPAAPAITAVTGEYLQTSVTRLHGEGFRQFLALGCGLPTWINSARLSQLDVRVVCVEPDLEARTRVSSILIEGMRGGKRLVTVPSLEASVACHPGVLSALDSTVPTAVLLTGPLAPLTLGRVANHLVDALRRELVAGSAFAAALAIGHRGHAVALRDVLPEWAMPWTEKAVTRLLARFGDVQAVTALSAARLSAVRRSVLASGVDVATPLVCAGLAYNTRRRGV